MNGEERKDIFLSCFKCGRIVKSSDPECPRCGLQFGPGTLFECPFCCGLVWRNAMTCSTCGTDLTTFSQSAERASSGFDMDEFVDSIITTELEEIKSAPKKVACPGCGLMLRGNEEKCPRCDLPLEEAMADCPVCSEKLPVCSLSCPNCFAVFGAEEKPAPEPVASPEPSQKAEAPGVVAELAPPKRKGAKKPAGAKKKPAKKGKVKKGE